MKTGYQLCRSGRRSYGRGETADPEQRTGDASVRDIVSSISAKDQHKTGYKQDAKSGSSLSRPGFCLRDRSGNLNRVTIEAVSGDTHDPWVLLRVCQPANIPESVETILQEELGLSQSEAHLARSLAETGSVSATIDLLNITRNTMKTHLAPDIRQNSRADTTGVGPIGVPAIRAGVTKAPKHRQSAGKYFKE